MKFSVLPQPVGLLKLVEIVFCVINAQGRELCFYFVKHTFNIGLCSDACKLISVKLSVMTDTTKLYIFIPV